VTDLTTQKRNEQVIVDEKLARAILEYASIAIVVCDPDGIIVRDSQMCRELAGGSVLQKPFTEAFALQADFSSQLRQTLQGATFGGLETRFQRPDGRWFDLMVSAGPLRGPQNVIQGCIIALTDITERKRSETDLRGKQRDIEALNHRLQRAMSETHHRVKNNLQVIIALVNMQLMDHPETVPSGELRRLTHHIKALATIHDLMTFQAKTDAEMTDVSVKEMVERFIPIVRDMMTEERELTLHVEELRLPVRYVTAVAVVLNELISNAAKHGEGVIGVRITNGDGMAHLEVTDEGPGFPPDFNPLTAANTGLDLLTSLVEWDLRGTMRYANNPNGGACVEVAFPIHEA
jgi:PAS domain S-box-containing protein